MKLTPEQLKQNAAAIIAFADGKPVECTIRESTGIWIDAHHLKDNEFTFETFLYRPKPEPKTRPWNCPDDVPLGCWLRDKKSPHNMAMVVHVDRAGMFTGAHKEVRFYEDLADFEYSTDRKTWHPCTVTE